MGRLIWFRCRYCGLDFHRQALAGESYYDSVSDNQAKRLADEGWGAEGDTLAQLGSNP